MNWWIWMLLGLGLAALELLTPGSLFWIFFAAGALAAGVVAVLAKDSDLVIQGLVFAAFSALSLAFFRRPLMQMIERRSPAEVPIDRLVGEVAVALEEIPAGGVGKAELRGTTWNATNTGLSAIPRATRCRVERVDGLMLWIGANHGH